MDVLDMMGLNPFSQNEISPFQPDKMSEFQMAEIAKYEFEKYGGFEMAKVEEFEPECISMFETNTRGRNLNRRKVVHCGEAPGVNQRVLMCKRSYNDVTVSVGISSWISE